MSDRYLWDKAGKPEPEVERLEGLLSRFAHRGEPLDLPEELPARPRRPLRPAPAFAWAAAAVVLAAAGAAVWLVRAPETWRATRVAGAPRVGTTGVDGGHAHLNTGETRLVKPGFWLQTDATSSVRLAIGKIGVVEIGPNSRLRVLRVRAPDRRLALERGSLLAVILAPPRQFFVETPSATAVDLGCAYTLEVDASGLGMITVIAGWVSFEYQGRESFIPAGARCTTRPGLGPGTPYFTDASSGLKNTLVLVDLVPPGGDVPDGALATVLAEARREDAFTLWHLLGRLSAADRPAVFDRLGALVPPPDGVTRDGVLASDRTMLDRWWDALGMGGTQDWRRWKGPVPGPGRPG